MADLRGILSPDGQAPARLGENFPHKWQLGPLALAGHNCSYASGLLFCGQLYNQSYLEQLLGAGSVSPAQLLRELFAKLGPEKALLKINGVFCLVFFHNNTLLLAKDHFGVAPLFYGQAGEDFIFSSQLSWLSNYPGYHKAVDKQALSGFIKFNWVPSNLCIYQGLEKVPPGHYVTRQPGIAPQIKRYFDPVQEALDARRHCGGKRTDADLLGEFETLLDQAVNRRLNSAGAQGLLLSGGMDSSLLACQLANKRELNAYTIGFREDNFNEAGYARKVAEKVRAHYHEQILDGTAALAILPRLTTVYEEPFADQSQIPTCAAMLLADPTQQLWLGDGGDELFMGYPRHLAHLKYAIPASPHTGQRGLRHYLAHPLRSFMYLALRQPANYIDRHITNRQYGSLLLNPAQPELNLDSHIYALRNPSRQAQLFDILTYLPGNGVIKASRLAASLGLNIASPLLDVDLFRFAQLLPMHLLAQNGQGKIIMRRLLYNHYPREWIDRPKAGFGAPVGQWLKREFAQWVDELANEQAIKRQGFFNYERIRHYRRSLGTRGSAANKLWAVLMFQTWAKREGII